MLCLVDLPTEVLSHIFQYLDGFTIENAARTCRRLYGVGGNRLKQHHERKRAWGTWPIASSPSCPQHLVELLTEQPERTPYLRSIRMITDCVSCQMYIWHRNFLDLDPKSFSKDFILSELGGSLVERPSIFGWVPMLMLPKLRSVDWRIPWYNQGTSQDIFAELIRSVAEGTAQKNFFPELEHMTLRYDDFQSFGLGVVRALPMLSSLKSLRLVSLCSDDRLSSKTAFEENYTLSELSMDDCVMNEDMLFDMLRSFKRLRKLNYRGPAGGLPNSARLCRAISDGSGDSLTSLSIWTRNEQISVVGDISQFKRLQKLEGDIELFFTEDASAPDTLEMGALLPPSLEEWVLGGGQGVQKKWLAGRCLDMLSSLESVRRTLPKLREVRMLTFRGRAEMNESRDWDEDGNTRKKLQSKGIEVRITCVLNMHPREWKASHTSCSCGMPYSGAMIACSNRTADSNLCRRAWYHLSCLGLSQAPQEPWTCDDCAESSRPLMPEA